jgi:hypothetical protein
MAETARAQPAEHELPARAFGREPRVSAETAVQTLTEIWVALIHRTTFTPTKGLT